MIYSHSGFVCSEIVNKANVRISDGGVVTRGVQHYCSKFPFHLY